MNRTVISGANGLIKLTIPVIGGRDQKIPLSDVRVVRDQGWQKMHYRALVSSYNRSPWFEHYHVSMTDFYKQDFEYLWEWNLASIKLIAKSLKLDIQIVPGFVPSLTQPRSQVDHQDVGDVSNDLVRYPQVFEDRFGFLSGLSILDTLFCVGPATTLNMLTRS